MIAAPDVVFKELFTDLHASGLWSDPKVISDAIPQAPPEVILTAYRKQLNEPNFDLKNFFERHFKMLPDLADEFICDTSQPVKLHIKKLWPFLERKADKENTMEGSSLIPLPHSYIVPGGRFNEIYYWDSYFTMLGLQLTGKIDQIQGMVDNFSYLIDRFGFIPNGNRTYFLGRSQPPFYAMMITLLAESKGQGILTKYLPQLKKEHMFWMRGKDSLQKGKADERVVALSNGNFLNRYFDNFPIPRQEMYPYDVKDCQKSGRSQKNFYLDVRSACESGWDFSCRWFEEIANFSTISTSQIVPVDLNCLLLHLEHTIAKASELDADKKTANVFKQLAKQRAENIQAYCWNETLQYYSDYQFIQERKSARLSLAAMYPLFFKIASQSQAKACAQMLESQFLHEGGLVSTPYFSGQQWDAPNGWAPLQWIAVKGLLNYGFDTLANEIGKRWLKLNDDVFKRTGKMMEKYNVVDMDLPAGGGEYEGQTGFGWTNGVYLKILDEINS